MQLNLFNEVKDTEPTGKAREEHAAFAAEEAGFSAGRRGFGNRDRTRQARRQGPCALAQGLEARTGADCQGARQERQGRHPQAAWGKVAAGDRHHHSQPWSPPRPPTVGATSRNPPVDRRANAAVALAVCGGDREEESYHSILVRRSDGPTERPT